jgi:hypothetical protein
MERFENLSLVNTLVQDLKSTAVKTVLRTFFFNFPLYLQFVPLHSANVVKSCTKACRRVLTSILLYLIGSEPSCDLGNETN